MTGREVFRVGVLAQIIAVFGGIEEVRIFLGGASCERYGEACYQDEAHIVVFRLGVCCNALNVGLQRDLP